MFDLVWNRTGPQDEDLWVFNDIEPLAWRAIYYDCGDCTTLRPVVARLQKPSFVRACGTRASARDRFKGSERGERRYSSLFAGKAHPQNAVGKGILQRIDRLNRDPRFAGKIVFVEDYDMNTARHLVQCVEVWLNNPRRRLAASGISDHKVVLNGGLSLSLLDVWWAEACDGRIGLAIGNGTTHSNQDRRDIAVLSRVLGEKVISLYYKRRHDGLPHDWIARIKHSIRTLGWRFSANRMVMDYVRHCYLLAAGGFSSDMRPN